MPWADNQPDPAVLAELYGPEHSNDPYDVVLAAMYARKRHLDLLIAMIEFERPEYSGADTGSVT